MYISRLALDHYRSCEHCVLDFEPGINILQGANGLGKTNIVKPSKCFPRDQAIARHHHCH